MFFPEINAGHVICQLPYTEVDEWVNHEISLDCGKSYTSPQHDDALRKFVVRYPSITREELSVIESFFDDMAGRTGDFSFIDDAGVTWPFVRFDQDELSIDYPQPGQISLEFKLAAVPA